MTLFKSKHKVSHISSPSKTRNLSEIIHPFYILLTIFGLFPYRISYKENKNVFQIIPKSFYVNFICAFSHIAVIITSFGIHIIQIFDQHQDSSFTAVLVTQLNYFIELLTIMMFSVVAYFYAYLNGARYVKMLNMISSALVHMPENSNTVDHVYKEVRLICYFWVIILCIHLAINATRSDGLWKIIIVTFSFILPECIQFLVLYFVLVLVLLVGMILRNLRVNMLRLSKNLKSGGSSDQVSLYEMETAYSKAFKVTSDITICFQASLMLTLLQSFHSIVSEAHIIYHGVVVEYILTLHEIVNCSVWIFWQLFKVYILAHAGGYLQREVKKLQQSLHDVPTEAQDIRMMLEVQHFSSRINIQSISVTVYGFFSMDSSLLFRVLGSVVMYLIMLVQFDNKKESEQVGN